MKIRIGFVSNSSSASFVIPTRFISLYIMEQIKSVADEYGWTYHLEEDVLHLSTSMNNGEMDEILDSIPGWSEEDE